MATLQQYPSAWNGFGTAVPLRSKVKLTPPSVPNVSGQFFMKKGLETAAWEASVQVALNGYDSVLTSGEHLVDILAIWYTLSDPEKKLADAQNSFAMHFGFRQRYDGVGLFVYKEGEDFKIVAREDRGLERVELDSIRKNYRALENGCKIPKAFMESGFEIKMYSLQSMLSVSLVQTRTKKPQNSPCFSDLFMKDISSKGFLGITARNTKRFFTDIDLDGIKIVNHDSNAQAYKNQNQRGPASERAQAAPSKMQYTDAIEDDASDIFDEFAQEEAMLEEYYTQHPGVIRKDDEDAEALIKMNEHLKHVNADMTRYIELEQSMQDYVKAHSKLPEILDSFMHIPETLEKHRQFVDTLDDQMMQIDEMFPEIADMAFEIIQRDEDGDLPGSVSLVLPDDIKRSIDIISKKAAEVAKDYMALKEQMLALDVVTKADALLPTPEPTKKKTRNQNTELLIRYEGDGWSDEVLSVVERATTRATNKLTNKAKDSSQWRSLVQIIMISLASLSLLAVWMKFNSASKKLML